jgi:hypothetical protein
MFFARAQNCAHAQEAILMENIQKMLDENVVLPLWPTTGKILGLSRNSTYARAEDGDIATIRLGRLRKVPTAWLRQKLGLAPS